MNDIITNFLAVLALSISFYNIYQIKIGWKYQRSIYNIERVLFFRTTNEKRNPQNTKNNEDLRIKLASGKYTILNTKEYGGYIELILGKIEK